MSVMRAHVEFDRPAPELVIRCISVPSPAGRTPIDVDELVGRWIDVHADVGQTGTQRLAYPPGVLTHPISLHEQVQSAG